MPTVTFPPHVLTATHAPRPQVARTGVWIAIATICMSFAALTSAMVVRGSEAPDWRHIQLPPILYFNTLILVASSVTLESARRRATFGLSLTVSLGLLFVVGQGVAWGQLAAQGLFLATGPSSAFLYLFTALHGVHVLGGLVALLYVGYRARQAAGLPPPTVFGAAALYWHFMAVLWIYLLLLLTLRA